MYELTYGPKRSRRARRCDLLVFVEHLMRRGGDVDDGTPAHMRFRHYLGGHARTWNDFIARLARIQRRQTVAALRSESRKPPRPRIWRVDEPYRNARWDGQHRSSCIMILLVDVCTRRMAVLGVSNDVRESFMRQPRCEAWLRRFAARLRGSGLGWRRLEVHPLRGYAGHRTFLRAAAATVAAGTAHWTAKPPAAAALVTSVPARAKETGRATSKSPPVPRAAAQEKASDDKYDGDGGSHL